MTICATGVATFLISRHVVILTCVFPFFYILVKSTWALVTGLSMVVYEEGRKLSDRPLFHCLFQLKLPQRGVYRSSGKPSSVAFTELVEGSCSISPRWRVRWTAGRSPLVFYNSLSCTTEKNPVQGQYRSRVHCRCTYLLLAYHIPELHHSFSFQLPWLNATHGNLLLEPESQSCVCTKVSC